MAARTQAKRRSAAIPTYAVVMAGGGSTRLWPLGRANRPKQVLAIVGKRTLLQETVERFVPTFTRRRILVVTGAPHAAAVRRQLPHLPPENILIEPMQRNTTACIALAADWIETHAGEAVMAATPVDHVIANGDAQRAIISAAIDLAAAESCLVTVGVVPAKADTGYGYVECGARVRSAGRPAFWVKRFHEKPPMATARRYARSGKHLWNAGIFVGRTSVFRRALAQCAPEISAPIEGVWGTPRGRAARIRRAYSRIPSVSFDIAVMQPLSVRRDAVARIAAVRGVFDWIDAGNWDAMGELWPHDDAGNSARGRVLAIDSRDSVVYSPERLVALVGIKDLIVVDAGDVVLVCDRKRAQDVRRVKEALKKRGWNGYL